VSRAAAGEGAAAIYLRISDDREGRELGVQRQEQDCRALAARLKVRVHRVYTDNDIGASTRSTKPRPEYKQMMADAKAGLFSMVIAYTSGRLTRRPREHEGQIELAESRGITYAYVASPAFDLNTSAGRRIARILAANDTGEAEDIAERVSRARLQRAQNGGYGGGGNRPYGFGVATGDTIDYNATVPDEAAVIVMVADQVLIGTSLASIARDLNDRGIVSATGVRWTGETLKDMLMRPRNAGLSVYKGEIVGTLPGEPILSEAVWRGVVARLTDPFVQWTDRAGNKRVAARQVNTVKAPQWLGSGLYRCMCGGPVEIGVGKGRKPTYRCNPDKRGPGDVHTRRNATEVDTLVAAVIVERLSRPDAADLVACPADDSPVDVLALRTERDALNEQLTELGTLYGQRAITAAQMVAATETMNDRLAEIGRDLATDTALTPLTPLIGVEDTRAAWDALPLGSQRAVVGHLMTVTILPTKSSRTFDPESVRIDWKS
jgi:site-specific DNA recombinase